MTFKFYCKAMLGLLSLLSVAPMAGAADTPVKREMRSAWVATVWRLDWPGVTISETGNTSQIQQQQKEMSVLLDSLAANNMNAINFQVRSRCDAMYKSSYEPWSSDLVEERGMEPGWDPLEWIVDECHKRGMECHAWVNPYRYESVTNQWDGTPKCYRETHPEWLLDVSGASILNPGLPEVTEQIVKVIREIVQNYDIDGVLFDDYFYLSGTPTDESGDGTQYAAYVEAGGTLSQGDWRRENVNGMVAAVYKMIQEEKPWVRFGISPAGVACTVPSHAAKFGISACPSGSDWQYNQIYSDPVAWIANHSLDYISPQIYWTMGYSDADYSLICPWWSEVAAHFGRHFYSSHSISSLKSSDGGYTPQAMSMREQSINAIRPKASGPNSTSYEEFANQIRLNRSSSLDGAPGSIFYSCKYLYKSSPKFAHYLKTTVFNTPALVPAVTWKPGYNPGNISNLSRNGATLTWSGYDNVRYTVYAVPTSMPTENFSKDAEYLLGTTYSTSFTVPDNRLSGYTYAVCVLDRYGNEYSPVFIGVPTKTMTAPTLVSPAAGVDAEAPFEFVWNAVTDASSYIIEIAEDAAFTKLLYTRLCYTTSCSTEDFENLPITGTLYWRVRACGNGYSDGISEARAFQPIKMTIISPESGSTGVTLTPTIEWNITDRDVTVEIATSSEFTGSSVIYTVESNKGYINVPAHTLGGYTTYFVRLTYEKEGVTLMSDVVSFTTLEIIPEAPAILWPVDNGEFWSEDYITATPVDGISKIRIDVSHTSSFGRTRYVEDCTPGTWCTSVKAGDMKVNSANLVVGTLYYMRVRGSYTSSDGSQNTDWSPVITAYYRGEGSGVETVVADASGIYVTDGELVINRDGNVKVTVITPAGVTLGTVFDGNVAGHATVSLGNYAGAGVVILIADTEDGRIAVKATL